MENRFDKIDQKLDALTAELQKVTVKHENQLTSLETTQKGVIALCLAVITAAFTALAKALHLV